jgi:tetratricopeptide (TPR) repeat protein
VDNLRGLTPLLADDEPETAQLLALTILRSMDDEGDFVSAVRTADRYVDDFTDPSPVRALLVAEQAHLHHRVGLTDTEAMLDEAERLNDSHGPEPEWARGWIGSIRADWLDATGQTEAAIAMAGEALEASVTDRERMLWLQQLGFLLTVDDPKAAVRYLEEGLAATPHDRHLMVAAFHSNIAECLMRLNQPAEAAAHQLKALQGGAQLGITMLVGLSLIVAARVAALDAKWGQAARLHGAADRIVEDVGVALQPDDIALSEEMLAEVERQLGDAFRPAWQAGYELDVAEATEEGMRALESAARGERSGGSEPDG